MEGGIIDIIELTLLADILIKNHQKWFREDPSDFDDPEGVVGILIIYWKSDRYPLQHDMKWAQGSIIERVVNKKWKSI